MNVSKECPTCLRRYPTGAGIAVCLVDKATLKQIQKEPMSVEEYKELCYIHGRIMPKSLPAEELIRIEREWDELDVEVARRGSRWTVPDLIAEGWFRPTPSAS